MEQEEIVLCGSSAYTKNIQILFDSLRKSVKQRIQIEFLGISAGTA